VNLDVENAFIDVLLAKNALALAERTKGCRSGRSARKPA
jgi:hypothetical protein